MFINIIINCYSFRILHVTSILLFFCLQNPLSEAASSSTNCNFECTSEAVDLVCGDDGITYKNFCEVQKVSACGGRNKEVTFKHKGACRTAPEVEKGHCLQERLRALKTTNETGIPIFVPVCRADGSYVEVQCFYGTGYCWCVNQEGKPEPGTSIQYERPKCRQKGQSKRAKRRNKHKNKKNSNRHRSHRKQACVQSDRSQFNRDVTNLIGSEYRSRHGKVPNGALNRQKEIVEWKFDQMDLDRNGILKRREFRTFKQTVKRLARNKVCARHFWRYCDMASDGKMTKKEWTSCLGLDTNIPFTAFMSLRSEEDQSKKNRKKESSPSRLEAPKKQRNWNLPSDMAQAAASSLRSGIQDCRSAHRQAIDESQSVNNAFIPECDEFGNYSPVQCYKEKHLCWCVERKTGASIPGTSMQGSKPNCNVTPRVIGRPSMSVNKPWIKCPDEEKSKFKTHLIDFLIAVMEQQGSYSTQMPVETVAKWHFYKLDNNHDGTLSRKELRPFRRKIVAAKALKRCGKRIQFHCDPNRDKSISESEWLYCILQIEQEQPQLKENAEVRESSLENPYKINLKVPRGPNPLEKWLNGD